jgi:hypothetical protein
MRYEATGIIKPNKYCVLRDGGIYIGPLMTHPPVALLTECGFKYVKWKSSYITMAYEVNSIISQAVIMNALGVPVHIPMANTGNAMKICKRCWNLNASQPKKYSFTPVPVKVDPIDSWGVRPKIFRRQFELKPYA